MDKKPKDKVNKTKTTESPDEFNTGIHSPDNLLNVGPGYDDTGMGSNSKTAAGRQVNDVRNPRTKRSRSRNRQY